MRYNIDIKGLITFKVKVLTCSSIIQLWSLAPTVGLLTSEHRAQRRRFLVESLHWNGKTLRKCLRLNQRVIPCVGLLFYFCLDPVCCGAAAAWKLTLVSMEAPRTHLLSPAGVGLQEIGSGGEPEEEGGSQSGADRGAEAGDQGGVRPVRHRRDWDHRREGAKGQIPVTVSSQVQPPRRWKSAHYLLTSLKMEWGGGGGWSPQNTFRGNNSCSQIQ